MTDTAMPRLGDTVHYRSFGTPGGEYQSQCRAAVVTEVGAWVTESTTAHDDGTRSLTQRWHGDACAVVVHNPSGQFFNSCITRGDIDRGGTWHMPCDEP